MVALTCLLFLAGSACVIDEGLADTDDDSTESARGSSASSGPDPSCEALAAVFLECAIETECAELACDPLLVGYDYECLCEAGGGAGTGDGSTCFRSWTCNGSTMEMSCKADICECRRDGIVTGSCMEKSPCDGALAKDAAGFALECCGFDVPTDRWPG